MPELFQDTLNSSLIPTKVASEISGYNADYLARLCREKKIEGTQVGRSWLINRSSLEVFVAEQEDRKKQRAEDLRSQREKEYRRAQKPILKATLAKTADMRDVVARSVAGSVATSRARATEFARTARHTFTVNAHSSDRAYSPKLAALAVALAVVAGTAYASTDARILTALNTIPNTAVRIALRTSPTTLEHSSSFRITEADAPTNLAQSVPTVPTVRDASRTIALLMPNANVAVLSSVRDLTDAARAPFAQTNVAAVASARIASVSDIAAHPGTSLVRAYVLSGESLYTVGATIANAYAAGISTVGDRTLARAATLRDGIAYIPHLTNALLDGYANGVYAWNETASKAPAATMLALYSVGDSISAHTAAVPALALQEQNKIAYNAGETVHTGAVMLAAATAPSVDAQYASSSAQSAAIASVGAITQPFATAYGTAVDAGGAILSLPVKAENTILGVAGYASSLVDGTETSSAVASSNAPASSAITASAVSFLPLSWQQAIGNLFHSVGTLAGAFLSSTFHSLAFLFPSGSVMAPTLTVLHTGPTETLALPIPTGVAHGGGDVAISTDNRTIIQNVVNNYFPTGLVGGAFDNAVLAVVRPFVNDSINASLKNNRGSGGSSVTTSIGGVNSDGATLTNVTISSGNATVTSLNASNSSLGTASATTFTAGTTTVGTTTVNGNLTITGTITAGSLSVGSLSYSGAVVAPSFQATDTAATSSFTTLEATKGVFTTLTVGTDSFTSLLGSGLVNLGGFLSVSTTTFSGSGSNFNADLLDGYDSAYLLANSFSTSSANAWMTSQTTDALAEGTLNQYFTNARARSAISVSGSSLSYASTTGILSVASGYSIPLTASTTDWNTAYLSRITVANAPLSILNNTLSLSQASASTNGYLSSADFNTFNNKQAALTFTYPLVNTANTISLAFGTTTSNAWSSLQTFSAGINVGASTFTSLLGTGLSNVGGALTVSTTSFSGSGSKFNADLLDNLDSTYFLANSFSSTSAAYFLSQNSVSGYSTTSANYWLTTKTTDDLAQGSTNKYYSDTLARAAISVSGLPLTYSAGVIGINQANGSQAGYLSSTDWNTFNGKQAALTFSYPLLNTANTISLAFGTSTSNTWGGTQTFTNAPVLGSLTGFLKATAGVLSTSLIDLSTDVSSTLPVSHGGTGSTSLTGILKGNGTGSLLTAIDGTDYVSPSTFGNSFYTYFHATTTDALAQGSTNKYYSDTLARAAISSNAVGLTYTAGSGVLSLTAGYTIPLTASTTDWSTFYATPSTRVTAGTNLSWAGNTLNGPSDSYIHNLFSAASPLSYNAGTGAFTFSTSSISGAGSNFNADLLDGLDSTYFLANAFSTTSAAYWKTQNNFYSTTSADFWLTGKSTTNLAEGSNLYYTASRVAGVIAGTTTDALAEGSTNLYFTNARADARINATSTIGTLTSAPNLGTVKTSLTGILKATSGVLSNAIAGTDYESPLTFTYPLQRTTNTISIAFGTTTANSWSALQTFSAGINVGASTFTSLLGTGLSNVGGALTVATSSFSGSGSNFNADLLDGQDGTYYLANAFSTTSAAYWKTQNNFYSTTSADFWLTGKSTTNLAEGTNLYYTASRVAGVIAGTTTDALAQGSVNKYYSDTLATANFVANLAATTSVKSITTLSSLSLPLTQTTGTLAQGRGGTGITSYTAGDILYADNSGNLAVLPIGGTGTVLKVQAGLPSWGVDQTVGGGGSDGIFATSSGRIYPLDTASVVLVGTNATSTTNSIFEVNGIQYISSKLGIATTSPSAALSVGGNGLFSGTVTAGNIIDSGLTTNSLLYADASKQLSSVTLGTGLSFTGGALSISTSTISGSGSLFNADLLDGFDSTYFLANAFGTTSANYWLTTKSTTNLAEGSNLYYTDARVNTYVAASTTIPKTYTSNVFSGNNTFNGSLSVGTLNGPLQANGGVVSATSSIGVLYGGTGLTTAPTYGQILTGNGSGGYTLSATSSLGLAAAFTATYPIQYSGNVLSLAFGTTTANTWSALQTFSAGINVGASTFTSLLGTGLSNVGGSLTVATSSFSGSGSNFNADLLDGLDSTYFLANGFGTTSANYWLTTKSTTDLAEGSNLYFTNARADARINATSTIGTLTSAPNLGTLSTTLTGILKATSGVLSNAVAGTDYQAPLTFTYPLVNSTNTISLAFGTTTANSWSALQTFNGGVKVGSLSGVLYGNSGTVAAAATSTATLGTGLSYSGTLGSFVGGTSGTLSISTSTFSGSGSNFNADLLDGQDGSYYLANAFSTTSAAYWKTQNNFYSTTSADFWLTGKSTTNLAEGSNLYYTASRVAGVIAGTTTDALAQGSVNKYYSDTLARAAFSSTATGLTYTSGTGVFSLTAGYTIPLTASTTDWNTAYLNRIASVSSPLSFTGNILSIAQAGTGSDGYLSSTDWNSFNNRLSTTTLGLFDKGYFFSTTSASYFLSQNQGAGYSTTSANYWLTTKSTTDLAEGTNLYFTNARADARINATSTIGTLTSAPNLGTVKTSLTGILKATSGVLSNAVAGTDYESPLTFTYPLSRTTNTISIAFGTTTANSWSALQTFSAGINVGASTFTSLLGTGLSNVGGALTVATSSFSGPGSNFNADFLDGYDSTAFLANGFSTTSADYWKTQRNFYSTTSADYWLTGKTTDNLTEGTTNLYWTNTRFDNRLSATTSLPNLTTLANLGTVKTSLTGILKATSGVLSNAVAGTDYENPLTFTYPLVRTTNTISLAFGTTTANSWSSLQTFTSGINALGNSTLANATSTNLFSTGLTANVAAFGQTGSTTIASTGALTTPSLTIGSLSGLLKASSGVVSTAVSGTDYAPATTGSNILAGNGAGGFNAVSISSPLTFIGTTLGIQQADNTQPGYLSSSDWSTFNGKQDALTGTTGQFPYFSGTNTVTATSTLFLAANGNVGVGTTSPMSALALGAGQLTLPAGSAGTPSLTFGNGITTGLYANGANVIGFTTSGTSRFSLSTSFQAANSGGPAMISGGTSGTIPAFIPNRADTTTGIGANASGVISLITAGTEKVTLTNAGNFGVGTTSPFSKLSVAGSTYLGGNLTATGTIAFTGLGSGLVKSTSGTLSTATAGTDYAPATTGSNILAGNGAGGFNAVSISSPLTFVGTTLGIQKADNTQPGYLSSTDWTTFNGKQDALTFSYPLVNTANTISLAFGTTTANSWSSLQTFNGGVKVGSLSGVLYGNSGTVAASATSTPALGTGLSYSGTLGSFVGGTSGTLSISTSSFSGSGSNFNADLLDGLDSTYFTGNSYSTTSANYWLTTKTTDNLTEGSTNLYWTNTRFDNRLSATTSLPNLTTLANLGTVKTSLTGILKATSGVLSNAVAGTDYENPLTFTYPLQRTTNTISLAFGTTTANSWSSLQTFNGGVTANAITLGTLNGPLQANNGVISATSSIGVLYGGTGLTSAPAFGQILVGNGAGYTLTATSSLGLLTTNVAEGSNLYFTNARADARINATSTIGTLTSAPNLGTLSTTLTGILKATSGVLSNAVAGTDYQAPLTFSYPLVNTANTISLAFGTTTANSWSSLQTFNGGVKIGSLSGVLYGNSGTVASVATSSATLGLGLSGSIIGVGTGQSLSIATSSLFSGTTGQFPYFSGTNTLTATSSLFLAASGNIGIGTTSPTSLFTIEGTSPVITISDTNVSGQAWQIRSSTAGGVSAPTKNLEFYDPATNKVALSLTSGGSNNGMVIIGSTTNNVLGNNSRLFIFGNNNGANVDLMGDKTLAGGTGDQSQFEAEGADWGGSNTNSIAIRYFGNSYPNGLTTFLTGLTSHNTGLLDFGSADNSIIRTATNTPILLGVNLNEVARVTSTGIGVGTTSPWGALAASTTSANPGFTVKQNGAGAAGVFLGGNVGIGTTTPYAQLAIGGNVVIGATTAGGALGDLFLPKLGTAAGTFLAVDATGKVIATSTPGGGTVTAVSINSANGFAGTSSGGATPALTISTTITGLLKGNGTAISAATAGTDYENPLTFGYPLVRTTNAISLAFGTTTANTWSALNTFNAGVTTNALTLGTLNGPLQANNGVISATTSVGVLYGGTGLTAAPAFGQILVGNGTGYTLTATSSLGLGTVTSVNASGGTTGLSFSGGPITSSGTLTLAGTLGVANGGTGSTTLSGILLGNGTGAVQTLGLGTGLSLGGGTLSIATSSLFTGTTGQFPYFSGTNTLTATSSLFLATSGNIGIGTTSPISQLTLDSSSAVGQLYINNTGASNNISINLARNNTVKALFGIAGGTNAAITGSVLDDFAIRTAGGNILFSTDSGSTAQLYLKNGGNIGIGTTTPTAKLALAGGNFLQSVTTAPVVAGSVSIASASNGIGTYVQGHYAYSVDSGSGFKLSIIDITTPSAPVVVGTVSDVTNLAGAFTVKVAGNYAYVTATSGGRLTVVDITNPSAPFVAGVLTNSALGGARGLYLSGRYAYVAGNTSGALAVVDISNPTSPSLAGSITSSGNLDAADSVYVAGKYAYVTSTTNNKLTIVDITNPAAPTVVGSYGSVTNISNPKEVWVAGRYAYVLGQGSNSLAIIDVSTPSSPTLAGVVFDGTTLNNPKNMFLAGRYAYVTANNGSRLTVIDVSNPAAPFVASSLNDGTNLNNARGVFVSGKYAYVSAGSKFTVVDIAGIDVPSANLGVANTESLSVFENGDIGNDLYVRNGLTTGTGGISSGGSLSVLGTAGVNPFTVASSTGTNLLTLTGAGNLGIGTTSPYAQLALGGGNLVLGAATAGGTPGDLFLPKLGTGAGAFLAVDASGKVIATTTPSGSSLTGTTGQVAYFSGANTAVGTSTLTIATNSNVGIGSTSPYAKLSVTGVNNGGGFSTVTFQTTNNLNTPTFTVYDSGSVSIGGAGAFNGAKLQINGTINSTAADTDTPNPSGGSTGVLVGGSGYWGIRSATNHSFNIDVYNSGSQLAAMTILQNGNLGLGTTTPFATLSVASNAGVYPLAIGSSTNPVFTVLPSGGVSVGTISETIASSGFLNTRGDLFASGSLASEGIIYTDSGLNLNGASILDSGANLLNLGGTIRSGSGNGLSFQTNGVSTARLVIDTSGNVGIGTTSPYAQLALGGGNLVLGAATAGGTPGDLFLPKLGTAAGTFLAVDASGKVIATTTPAGGGSLTGTTGQVAYFSGTNTAVGTSTLFISTAGRVGIGQTSPTALLHITGTQPAASTGGTAATDVLKITGGNGGDNNATSGFAFGGTGANVSIAAGAGGAITGTPSNGFGGNGGNITLTAGAGGVGGGTSATAGAAGIITINGGAAPTATGGVGGPVNISGGSGGFSGTTGGSVYIGGGTGVSTATAGNVILGFNSNVATNPRGLVGVGTSTPWGLLSVDAETTNLVSGAPEFVIGSSSTTHLLVNSSGYLGLGTTTPYAQLSITGDAVLGASTAGGTPGDLFLPKLGTAAGTFLAVDASGKVIATTTPAGGGGGLTGSTGQVAYFSGANTAVGTSTLTISTASNLGIGTSTPWAGYKLAVNGTALVHATTNYNLSFDSSGISAVDDSGALATFIATGGTATLQATADANVKSLAVGAVRLSTAAGEKLTVTSGGNVGIASTTPTSAFSVGVDSYFGGNVGIGSSSPTAALSFAAGGTTAAKGINFGDGTANLYRSSAGTIKTDGGLNVGTGVITGLTPAIITTGGFTSFQNVDNAGLNAIAGSGTAITETVATGLRAILNLGGVETWAPNSASNSASFNGLYVAPTLNAGGSNVGGTFYAARINPTITSTTGLSSVYLFAVGSGSSDKFVINSAGNVGIGTTTPYAGLSLGGGNLVVGASTAGGTPGDLFLPKLGTAAGAFLAVDANGKVIATTTPSGGGSANGIAGAIQFSDGSTFLSDASNFFWNDSLNRLGLGTSTPKGLLGLQSATNADDILTVSNSSGANTFAVSTLNSTSPILSVASSTGTEYFEVAAGGNVGIGVTSPTAQLHTTGSVRFANFGAGTVTTDASGNITVSSDERLKNIDGSFNRGLAAIEALSPIEYHWKASTGLDTTTLYAGFSAQNVQSAIPEAVDTDPHGYLTLQDRPILAASVNAIKELASTTSQLSISTTTLGAQFAKLSAQFASTTQAASLPHDLTATNITATTLSIATQISVNGIASANRYVVPQNATTFTIGSSTITTTYDSSVLAANGTVDLYKLASYAVAGVQALTSRTELLSVKIDDLESRLAALEALNAGSSTGTDAQGAVGLAVDTVQNALKSLGIIVHDGIAMLDKLVTHQLVLVKGQDGTSSTGSEIIPVGSTNITVTNPLVHTSSKIFLTFTSSVDGSWYLSEKKEGSFTVTLSKQQSADVSFDYFLLQTDPDAQIASVAGAQPPAGSQEAQSGAVVTLNGDASIQIAQGAAWVDPGATAKAADGTDITGSITVAGSVDSTTPGTYTISYNVTDSAGNGAQATRTVTVLAPLSAPSTGSGSTSTGGATDSGSAGSGSTVSTPPASPTPPAAVTTTDTGGSTGGSSADTTTTTASGDSSAGTGGTTVSSASDATPAS